MALPLPRNASLQDSELEIPSPPRSRAHDELEADLERAMRESRAEEEEKLVRLQATGGGLALTLWCSRLVAKCGM